jgi:hypothetical protein
VRASLDGGDTWTPSQRITEKPTVFGGTEQWVVSVGGGAPAVRGGRGPDADSLRSGGRFASISGTLNNFTFSPGHNGAFSADAAGGFHPVWIDNRTGLYQMWTTTLKVDGTVARNGGGVLAELADLTGCVTLQVVSTDYDRPSNRLTFTTRLRNTTHTDTIRGPIKVRAIRLGSQLASSVEIVNADNQVRGPGGVWDFASALPDGGLLPDSLSAPKPLVFQLAGLLPFRDGAEFRSGLVNMDSKILGAPPAGRTRAVGRQNP